MKTKPQIGNEYENFTNLLDKLLKVPHSALKAKLDAEKRTKAKKRQKVRKSSASQGGSGAS